MLICALCLPWVLSKEKKKKNHRWPALCLPWVLSKGEKIIVTFPTENVRGTCTWQESTASHFNRNIEAAKLALLSVFLFDRNFSNLKGSVAWLPPAPNIMQESFGTCTTNILDFLSRNDKGLPWWSRHTKKKAFNHMTLILYCRKDKSIDLPCCHRHSLVCRTYSQCYC